jgi:pilus assembly protein CpaF
MTSSDLRFLDDRGERPSQVRGRHADSVARVGRVGLRGTEGGGGAALPTTVIDAVRADLIAVGAPPDPAHLTAALHRAGIIADEAVTAELVDRLRQDLVGAGPLEPLLGLPGVTDVLVNGPGEVWIDRGSGLERTGVSFRSEAELRALAQRLAAGAGRRLDDASPYVDARLGDGVRLHAVLPPISPVGTLISLRVPRRRPFTVGELVSAGSMPPALGQVLIGLIRSRTPLLLTGGTGTGKTTVLAALLAHVDPYERMVVVEDSAELVVDHPHVVRLEARPANVEGAGQVTLRDLVRQAMRMRPDRIVVGEVRGAEVVDLLAALNTGHEGGLATVHANDVVDVPARMEALALAAGMTREAVHAQLAAGVDAVVHVVRDRAGQRRVGEVGWLTRRSDGLVQVRRALRVCEHGLLQSDEAAGQLARRLGERSWADGLCPECSQPSAAPNAEPSLG